MNKNQQDIKQKKQDELKEEKKKYQYAPLPDREFTVLNDCLIEMFGLSIAYLLSNIASWSYTAEKKKMKNSGFTLDGKGFAVFTNSEWLQKLNGAFKKTWTYKLLKDVSKLSFIETRTFKKYDEEVIGYRINKKRLEAYLFFNDGKTDISKLTRYDQIPGCEDLGKIYNGDPAKGQLKQMEHPKKKCFRNQKICDDRTCEYFEYCREYVAYLIKKNEGKK